MKKKILSLNFLAKIIFYLQSMIFHLKEFFSLHFLKEIPKRVLASLLLICQLGKFTSPKIFVTEINDYRMRNFLVSCLEVKPLCWEANT